MKIKLIGAAVAALILTGCGSDGTTQESCEAMGDRYEREYVAPPDDAPPEELRAAAEELREQADALRECVENAN